MSKWNRLMRDYVTIVALGAIVIVFTVLYTEGFLYSPDLLIMIFVGASLGLLIWASYGSAKKLEAFEEWRSGETHSILYKRICKDIQILNEQGDATIRYSFDCRRNPETALKQLKHEIFHDGKAELIEVLLDGMLLKAETEEFVVTKKTDGEELIPQPYRMKIKIAFPEGEPKRDFGYTYTTKCEAVYPDMDKERKEFTAHHVILPTFWLKIRLMLPKNIRMTFLDRAMYVEVLDIHEVEDAREVKRIAEKYPPEISRDGKTIVWELREPKIAYTYKLYFLVEKEDTAESDTAKPS